MQLHPRCWSLRLSCWQPFTIVLKSEAAILCASPSGRFENTFALPGTITLAKNIAFLRGKRCSSPAPEEKVLSGGPNFGTVNLFAACAGLLPAGRESKREIAEGYGLLAYVKCFAMNSALAAKGCLLLALPGLSWEAALFPQTLWPLLRHIRTTCLSRTSFHYLCSSTKSFCTGTSGSLPRNSTGAS
jgi:hypothetical protein